MDVKQESGAGSRKSEGKKAGGLKLKTYGLWFLGLSLPLLALATPAPLPSPEAGSIAQQVGKILSTEHYRHLPLDESVSQKFLDEYLDILDYSHHFFMQSDIQDFHKKYSTELGVDTLWGDVHPAFNIFSVYIQRVEECVELARGFLKEKVSFDMDESIEKDRHESPWPANDAERRELWRKRVKLELLEEALNGKKPEDAVKIVTHRYEQLVHFLRQEDSETVLQIYLTSLARTYDPHGDYFPPSEEDSFEISLKLSLYGIGARLESEDGYAKVVGIIRGGPADLDKRLKINDKIVGVGQGDGPLVDIVDMKLSKAVELIRGPTNTVVHLSVIPADAPDPSIRKEIRLVRNKINMEDQEASAKLMEGKDAQKKPIRLGYINLPEFYGDSQVGFQSKSTAKDVGRLIIKLQSLKMDGLVLDLRFNGGGLLSEAVRLSALFVGSGPVVQVKDASGRIQIGADNHPLIRYDGPLIILVNRLSASASEIFAAALQDYGVAVVVGDKSTYGKGTVQRMEDLKAHISGKEEKDVKGGALKFTIQKFYRVSGGSTQFRGVLPDIQLPTPRDYLKNITETSLKNVLPYDEVPPAPHLSMNRVFALLPELERRSQERISHDPEYGYIREDISLLQYLMAEQTISLNENKRQLDKKKIAERMELRKKERQSRKKEDYQVAEISIKSLDLTTAGDADSSAKSQEQVRTGDSEGSPEMDLLDSKNDPALDETLRILKDLISLSTKN